MVLLDSRGNFRSRKDFVKFFKSFEDVMVFLNLKVSKVLTYQILGQRDLRFDF